MTPDHLFLSFQQAVAGRYSILRELGRGGMGVVYLAHEVHLDRLVAIKLLPPALSARPPQRERFLREARLAAKLSHPNIIAIHAVDQIEEFVFYVMAYVDGETLAQRVHNRGPLSTSDGIALLRDVAWALGYAHQQGLVHRDVKPDNILIESATGRALVADFGIAAAAGDAMENGVSGTPEFMSPEQALGGDPDPRSDLYSLGATAFYALSGRLPIEGKTTTEILARQVNTVPQRLDAVGSNAPRKLSQLIDQCLSKVPERRPATAEVLAEQLAVTLEQRRELPAALRAFVKRNGRMDGGGTIISLFGALGASIAIAAVSGPLAGVGVLLSGTVIAPIVFSVVAARKLLSQGFSHADLSPAFKAEREIGREERKVMRGRLRSFAESTLRTVARVTGATGGLLVAFSLLLDGGPRARGVGLLTAACLTVATVATVTYVALLQTRRDVDLDFWGAAWTGRSGATAFAIAQRLLGARRIAPAMTHRATELSLGMAAEQLFESLPKASRESLGDLPRLLERLQRDAKTLRAHYGHMQDALQSAGSDVESMQYASVREQRDHLGERLRTTVGALETIRLSLLRLHAGSLSLEGLTTHVALAADVSADVERLVAAREEVEHILRYPHAVALTPA